MKRALCLIVSSTIMLLFSSAFAGKRETKTVQVGDEFTVYTTPQYHMKNVVWEWDYNVLEVVGSIGAYSTSAKFRAKKASPSAGVVVQATTYYYVTSGSYTYVATDYDSYTIHVKDNTTVSFAKSEYQIEYETPGQSSATYIEAIPSNSSYAGNYKWSASDYDCIYLNEDGKRACIHPRKVGQTTLTVTLDNGSSAQCHVRVVAPEPKSVDIDTYMSIVVGSGQSLKPTLSPTYAETTYSWESDDPSIASVSSSGYVTGRSVGNTYVRVRTANGKTDACHVTVSPKQPESVSLPKSLFMVIGDSRTLDAVVSPADASYNLIWKSSDENVATVSPEGKVIAVSKGSAVVTVSTQNGKSASCCVVVDAPLAASLTLSSTELSLCEGQETRIEAVVLPENAEFSIEWVSSNEEVATVENGLVSALATGRCRITARTKNGLESSCEVTVIQKNKPYEPTDNNDWAGTYSVKSNVVKYDDTAYDYPSEYSLTIDDVEGKLYVTSLIGLDCTKTYPYTGIPVRIESETSAIFELDIVNNAGARPNGDEYIGGLLLLSANSEYAYDKPGNITITRLDDGSFQITDFYVFFFGLDSDFEYRKTAFYYDNKSNSKISNGLTIADSNDIHTNEIEIFNLNGIRVYKGTSDADIQLKSDIYIIRRGNKTTKTLIRCEP